MSLADNDVTDFRSRAAAASEALRRTLPSGSSLEESGISYCMARQPSLSRYRRPIKITIIVSGMLGLLAVGTGAITALLSETNMIARGSGVLTMALCCCVAGILLLWLPMFVERGIVRQHLSRGDEAVGFGPRLKGLHVSVEHASTYSSMKLLAEDVGLIYIHPEAHYVKIDGLSYEYLIHSRHVLGISLHRNGKSVLLSYAVGEEQLDLAIVPRSLLAELRRQVSGSSPGLFAKIGYALISDVE